MWNYITNKTTILVVLICILAIFIIIQWYETKKLRHKISKIDKQIHSLGKNQLHLEKLITKSLTYPVSLPSYIPSKISTPSTPSATMQPQSQRLSKPKPSSKPSPPPQLSQPLHQPPQQIIIISETHEEPLQEGKIVEIDSENSSDDEDTTNEEEFNDKTLDLELEKELNELN